MLLDPLSTNLKFILLFILLIEFCQCECVRALKQVYKVLYSIHTYIASINYRHATLLDIIIWRYTTEILLPIIGYIFVSEGVKDSKDVF